MSLRTSEPPNLRTSEPPNRSLFLNARKLDGLEKKIDQGVLTVQIRHRRIYFIFPFLFLVFIANAELQRQKSPFTLNFSSTIQTGLYGAIKNGLYYSPEKTCVFKVPPMPMEGLRIHDFTDGVEVGLTIEIPTRNYKLDVYRSATRKKKFNDLKEFADDGFKKFGHKKMVIFYDQMDEKFDMVKSDVKLDIFAVVLKDVEKKYPNRTANITYLMANDKFYRIFSVINWDDFPDEKGKRVLTDEELITKGKANILDLLSRLYIHTPEQNEEFGKAGKALREQRESENKALASVSSASLSVK